jgi:hypothetical protein
MQHPAQSCVPHCTLTSPSILALALLCCHTHRYTVYTFPHCAGLYGKLAPVSAANMVAAVQAGAFTQSAFSRISPGEYIQAGRRGSRRLGDIAEVSGLAVSAAVCNVPNSAFLLIWL